MATHIQNNMRDFYIGLFLAMSSSIFIGISFIFKKKALIRLASLGIRAGDGGYGYLKDWVWWTGMILMASGEGANFAAYAFAPATLVTPLGALSVLVSSILSSHFLSERLNLLGKVGCLVCIMGSTMFVIHSPKEQEIKSLIELSEKMQDVGFIMYSVTIILLAGCLMCYFAPRYGQTNPLVYITITGSIGSLSVMGCKALGVAIKQSISGDNQMNNWLTWLIIICVVVFLMIQMNYLNRALDIFNTSVVTPLLYVFFTTFVILASAILFKEWYHLGVEDYMGNIAAFVTICSGIFLLHGFKDLNINLSNLNVRVKRDDAKTTSTFVDINDTCHHEQGSWITSDGHSKLLRNNNSQDGFMTT